MEEVKDLASVVFFGSFAWWVGKMSSPRETVLVVAAVAAFVLAVLALVRLFNAMNARRASSE